MMAEATPRRCGVLTSSWLAAMRRWRCARSAIAGTYIRCSVNCSPKAARTRRRHERRSGHARKSGSRASCRRRRLRHRRCCSMARTGISKRLAGSSRRAPDRRGRDRTRSIPHADRGDHVRADAGCVFQRGYAAVLQTLEFRQGLRPQPDDVQQGLSGAGVRDRHQLRPLHLLHHGGELRDDADAGAGARGHGAQPLFQEQLCLQAVDRRERHCGLSVIRQELHRQMRRTLWRGECRAADRCSACAAEPRHPSLSRQAIDGSAVGGNSRA
jgi:hypothetical protein